MLFNVSVAMAIVGVVVGNRIEKHLKQEYFAKEHAKMMAQLDTGLLGELAKVSASVAHKTAYINPTPTVKWKPVQVNTTVFILNLMSLVCAVGYGVEEGW